MTEVVKRFSTILTQFTNELSLSYPELSESITAFVKRKKEYFTLFGTIVPTLKPAVASRNDAFFLKASGPGVEILPGIHFSAKLWKETGKETRDVFWNYLASLILLHSMHVEQGKGPATTAPATEGVEGLDDVEKIIENMTEGMQSAEFKEMFETMKNTFKGFAEGDSAPKAKAKKGEEEEEEEETETKKTPFEIPSIPEHLKNGQIAKIAAELAGEFTPQDLGIDTEMMEKMNPIQIFEHLQFVYTNNPTLLTSAMKRVAKKIQNKFSSGALNRDVLMAEAKELMEHFTDNPAFREMFESFGSAFANPEQMFGGGGGGGGNTEQSERLRKVKERMKAKLDKRQKKK